MNFQEHIPIGTKTTMKIGGTARFYAEIVEKNDVEEAWKFAQEKNLPLIMLGGGSNTIFADSEVNAVVCRMKADAMTINSPEPASPTRAVTVQSGKILASLINELANSDLDLSALTGIPGTVGGAVFGNAGQGAGGTWINSYIEEVTFFVDGEWKTWKTDECDFRYRESKFKEMVSPIIWEVTLNVPSKPGAEVKAEVERLINKRIETQPHIKTAGSCFKSLPDGTPAWKLIDAAGLRGTKIGGIQIAEKHANFLLNVEKGTFSDAVELTNMIREKVPEIAGIEMRFYGEDGKILQK